MSSFQHFTWYNAIMIVLDGCSVVVKTMITRIRFNLWVETKCTIERIIDEPSPAQPIQSNPKNNHVVCSQ
jgi:hypothetical protein